MAYRAQAEDPSGEEVEALPMVSMPRWPLLVVGLFVVAGQLVERRSAADTTFSAAQSSCKRWPSSFLQPSTRSTFFDPCPGLPPKWSRQAGEPIE